MFMKEFLFVGLGGAVGAKLRYGMSMVPVKSEFPYIFPEDQHHPEH